MPPGRATTALAVAAVLAATAAQTHLPAQEPPCTGSFTVPEQSFQRLDDRAPNSYVWIGDIETRFFVSYRPFDMYVLVGETISPFQARSGRLDQKAFDRIAETAYNTRRFGPSRVTPDGVEKRSATLAFTARDRRFTLSVVSVDTGGRRGASAQMRLCWPERE